MAMSSVLKMFLATNKIKYKIQKHPLAYTAQEIAAKQHFPGKEMAKVVMLDVDGALVMGVIPGSRKISLEMVKASLGAKKARLATEDEFIARFPDCEIGAMPPFGNLYHIPVYVARKLSEDEEIAFNAGTHRELIKMKYRDFERLVKPKVFDLTAVFSRT